MNLFFQSRLLSIALVLTVGLLGVSGEGAAGAESTPEAADPYDDPNDPGLAVEALAPGVERLGYYGHGVAELGKYRVEIFDPISKYLFRVDFELMGRTELEKKQDFQKFMNGHLRSFKEQVSMAVRTCTLDDLRDPTHRIFAKRITARVNRIFGKDFLEAIEIPHYLVSERTPAGSSFVPLEMNRPGLSSADSP